MLPTSAPEVLALQGAFLLLSLGLVALRIFYRIKLIQRISGSDILIIIGWLFSLAFFLITIQLIRENGVKVRMNDVPAGYLKLIYAQGIIGDVGLYFVKGSLLCFYWVLIPETHRELRSWIYYITALTAIAGITTCLIDVLWCLPISKNWEAEYHCRTFFEWNPVYLVWSLLISTDLCVFLLPYIMVRQLSLTRKQTIELLFALGLGLVTTLTSITRFVVIRVRVTADNGVYFVLMTVEYSVAIVIVCITKIRILRRRSQRREDRLKEARGVHDRTSGSSEPGLEPISVNQGTFEDFDRDTPTFPRL